MFISSFQTKKRYGHSKTTSGPYYKNTQNDEIISKKSFDDEIEFHITRSLNLIFNFLLFIYNSFFFPNNLNYIVIFC